ncbi:programmed cell death protein 2 [Hypoxylon sp. NC1633]|nr:programmed cell death protein 2 [Hypoxylon sp. NC1633]
MAPYDSDSSLDEEAEYTETNVLLGYPSKDADKSISRLGGRPDWLDTNIPPSASLARCKICKDLMVLLLQLDGELPERFPGHERRLYVFSCRRKSCRRREGSIRALRCVRVAPVTKTSHTAIEKKESGKTKLREEKPGPQPPSNLGERLFGAKTMGSSSDCANPFSTTTSSSGNSNPFTSSWNPSSSVHSPLPVGTKPEPTPQSRTELAAPSATTVMDDLKSLPQTFAQTLSLNNDQSATAPTLPDPWPVEAQQPAPYPISYLSDAEYEILDPVPTRPVPRTARMDIDSDGKGGGNEDREVFESSMDAAFQRFADRLAQNPEQAIRYEFGGQPLLYSKTDGVGRLLSAPTASNHNSGLTSAIDGGTGTGVGIPRCPSCTAPRTFEVQMTPHAITELEADELSLEGMDWGTIIVGVCERDCQPPGVFDGQAGYLEEWAGVQWEDLSGGAAKK